MRLNRAGWLLAGSLLLAAAGWKAILILRSLVPFNGDEAVVALMARHILQGERPIFFYGQAYMGSLDAFLIAAAFLLLGQSIWVVRLTQMLLYLATMATTILLGMELFGNWKTGFLAAAILTVPAVNVTLYTTATLGGYGEAILIGNCLLLLALRISRKPGWIGMTGFGFLAGLGLWANALTVVYTLPSLLFMGWRLHKQPVQRSIGLVLPLIVGGFAGSAPWWIFALQNGLPKLLIVHSIQKLNTQRRWCVLKLKNVWE